MRCDAMERASGFLGHVITFRINLTLEDLILCAKGFDFSLKLLDFRFCFICHIGQYSTSLTKEELRRSDRPLEQKNFSMCYNHCMKKRIAVLIPCYNEASTIKKVVRDFTKALPEADIFVYDNNSTDDTAKIAKKNGAIVRHEYRQGKGNVIRSMFREIDADAYLIIDGDDTYPPENAQEMIDLVLSGRADMVIGDRLSATYYTENKRRWHGAGNKLVRSLINSFFHAKVKDVMTGYRAFSYEFVKTYPVLSKGFEVETEMTIHALDKNLKLVEVPVAYRDRPAGSVSKLNTIPDGMRVLRTIFNLVREYKPLFFFSIFSLISLLVAIYGAVIVLIDFAETGLVPKMPTLLVAVFFAIISILSFVAGLILDAIARKYRQNFEIQLNQFHENHKK